MALPSVKHDNPMTIREILDKSTRIFTKAIYLSLGLSTKRS